MKIKKKKKKKREKRKGGRWKKLPEWEAIAEEINKANTGGKIW